MSPNGLSQRRFVVLQHKFSGADAPAGGSEASRDHWDLLIESETLFATWSISAWPEPEIKVVARRLPDHRSLYWDYEGKISGNRGTVRRWDRGTCDIDVASSSHWKGVIQGQILRGTVELTLAEAGESASLWQLVWSPDH